MIRFLKWAGLANAAFWLGGALFFTFIVAPALFSDAALAVFGGAQNAYSAKYYVGALAEVVVGRYFLVHQVCGALAMLHAFVSWIYTGRPLQRWMLWMIAGAFVIGLIGGFWLQPKMHHLHEVMYGAGGQVTLVQAESARRSFRLWHGFSQALNGLALLGIAGYFWELNRADAGPRFTAQTKFGWE